MSVLIKGGRIITAADDYVGDVFAGTTTCDDFTSGTVAAAFGGTTSLVDFCMQAPGTPFPEALENYFEKIERAKPVIDVGFHIGVTDLEGGGRGEDRSDLARADAPDGDGGRGHEPGDPVGARRRMPALRRPRLLPAGRRADRARAGEGLGRLGRDVHAVPLRRRERAGGAGLGGREVHLHAAAAPEGAAGAPLEGARHRRPLRRLHRPLPVQLAGPEGGKRA